jgi:AcrR family transcriptional regulator
MSAEPRKYRLQARADRQRQTRQRIVSATADLHREVGPARTTIADIARRAGVQRLTVYNNFPRLGDLLAACQSQFLASNPPPPLVPDEPVGDPPARMEVALARLYGWYRVNAELERHVQHDRHLIAELDEVMRRHADPALDAAAAAHANALARRPSAELALYRLIRLAFDFSTWEILDQLGVPDGDIAMLFRRAAECLAAGPAQDRAEPRKG